MTDKELINFDAITVEDSRIEFARKSVEALSLEQYYDLLEAVYEKALALIV